MLKVENITQEELDALPPQFRQVMASFIEHGNYKAVADGLNLPLGTVKSRLNRARQAILKSRQPTDAQAEAA